MFDKKKSEEITPLEAAKDTWAKRHDIWERFRDDMVLLPDKWQKADRSLRLTAIAGVVLIVGIILLQLV